MKDIPEVVGVLGFNTVSEVLHGRGYVMRVVGKEGSLNQEDRVVVRRGYREVSDIGFVEKEFPLWIRKTSV